MYTVNGPCSKWEELKSLQLKRVEEETLNDEFGRSQEVLEKRIQLIQVYLIFHDEALNMSTVIDQLALDVPNADEYIRRAENQLLSLQSKCQTFLRESTQLPDPYLSVSKARDSVSTLLRHFQQRLKLVKGNRQQKEVTYRLDELFDKATSLSTALKDLAYAEDFFGEAPAKCEHLQAKTEDLLHTSRIEEKELLENIGDSDDARVVAGEQFAMLETRLRVLRSCIEILKEFASVRKKEPPILSEREVERLRFLLLTERGENDDVWAQRQSDLERLKEASDLSKEVDSLHDSLRSLHGSLKERKRMSYPPTTGLSSQAKAVGTRVLQFVAKAERQVSRHPEMAASLSALQQEWESLQSTLGHARKELADEFLRVVGEVEVCNQRSNVTHQLLLDRSRNTDLSLDESRELVKSAEGFIRHEKPLQEERLERISQLAAELYGDQWPTELETTVRRTKDMLSMFQTLRLDLRNHLDSLEEARRKQTEAEILEAAALTKANEAASIKASTEAKEAAEMATKTLQAIEEKLLLSNQPPPTLPPPPSLPPPPPMTSSETTQTDKEAAVSQTQTDEMPLASEMTQTECDVVNSVPEEPTEKTKSEKTNVQMEKNLSPPVFTKELSDAEVPEGAKHQFICRLIGAPCPEVWWLKDGLSVKDNPDYSTTFEDDREEEPCPPDFPVGLQHLTVREGQKAVLRCTVSGHPEPDVYWFRNTIRLPEKEASVGVASPEIRRDGSLCMLIIHRVDLEDQGNFTCRATNSLGFIETSADLKVTPIEPFSVPRILLPLSNVMARAGQRLKLECHIQGNPAPTIQWKHGGRVLRETGNLTLCYVDGRACLEIREAFPSDAGTYVLVAKNRNGEATSSALVSVKGQLPAETSDSEVPTEDGDKEPCRPAIGTNLPPDLLLQEGSPLLLECFVSGQPDPEVLWYLDGSLLTNSKERMLSSKGENHSLRLAEVKPKDQGLYRIVAINSVGEASAEFRLRVRPNLKGGEPPKFLSVPQDINTTFGSSFTLKVSVAGRPMPTVQWFKDGVLMPESGREENKDSCLIHSWLSVEDCKPMDAGVYLCKAENDHGEASAISSIVTPHQGLSDELPAALLGTPPHFTEVLRSMTISDSNQELMASVSIEGDPTPKVSWLLNELPLMPSASVSFVYNHPVYTLRMSCPKNSSVLTCAAENSSGKARSVAPIEILAPTPEIYVTSTVEEKHTVYSSTFEDEENVSTWTPKNIFEVSTSENEVNTGNWKRPSSPEIKKGVEALPERPNPPLSVPPAFVKTLKGVVSEPERRIALEGELAGDYVNSSVTWLKDGMALTQGANLSFACIPHLDGRVWLSLESPTEQDSGHYVCEIRDEKGELQCQSGADILVEVPPPASVAPPSIVSSLPSSISVNEGDNLALKIKILDAVQSSLSWFRNEIQLHPTERVLFQHQGNEHSLLILETTDCDSGIYSAVLRNEAGESRTQTSVTVTRATKEQFHGKSLSETELDMKPHKPGDNVREIREKLIRRTSECSGKVPPESIPGAIRLWPPEKGGSLESHAPATAVSSWWPGPSYEEEMKQERIDSVESSTSETAIAQLEKAQQLEEKISHRYLEERSRQVGPSRVPHSDHELANTSVASYHSVPSFATLPRTGKLKWPSRFKPAVLSSSDVKDLPNFRIRPVWYPPDSDSEDPVYRPLRLNLPPSSKLLSSHKPDSRGCMSEGEADIPVQSRRLKNASKPLDKTIATPGKTPPKPTGLPSAHMPPPPTTLVNPKPINVPTYADSTKKEPPYQKSACNQERHPWDSGQENVTFKVM
ncbi:unnamed protein product [Cyprideis torosa]|uniref:Uncharacterized protein n=1 Tax=Cyprideis torosa TaxID=163714 RepID=A0A7R8W7J6_9CRUS|nr:unnamed protein product [Cyprideis torosa]CAG0882791.1 unnamed protein product [Cyprideis torosa]